MTIYRGTEVMAFTFTEFKDASFKNGVSFAIVRARQNMSGLSRSLFDEKDLNDLGYHYLNELDRVDDAIEIFKFNVSLFPDSPNTYDSLGEAYFVKGDLEEASHNYKRSLQVDPQNNNARLMLRQIRFIH